MRMSDLVARHILEMLEEQDGNAEIRRNELASALGCVPSQINYVISTSVTGRKPARESVKLRRKSVERSIACLTSVDTANALVSCIEMKKSIDDIEMVDITKI